MKLIDSDKLHTDLFIDHIGNMAETETLVHSYKYYHDKAAESWNVRVDN